MAVFRFRLQNFLNVKIQMEKSIKNELGIAIRKWEEQKKILATIHQQICTQQDQYRQESVQKTTTLKLKQRLEYIHSMQKKEILQQHRVNEEKKNVDTVRERLVDIMKEKKVLEKLREKELDLYLKEQEKSQQLLVDELVSFRESIKTIEE